MNSLRDTTFKATKAIIILSSLDQCCPDARMVLLQKKLTLPVGSQADQDIFYLAGCLVLKI